MPLIPFGEYRPDVSDYQAQHSAHIANAEKRPLVEAVCRVAGYEAPILCTPDELMGEDSYVDAR